MIRTKSLSGHLLAPVGLALLLGGCGGPEPEPGPVAEPPATGARPQAGSGAAQDPDDVPITQADVARPEDYPEAVTRIRGYRDSIRDAIAAGTPTKAHRALDELDIVLDWLPAIARDGGVPKASWEAVNTDAQRLRELFNKVHAQIDAGQPPDFDAIAGDVEQVLGRLASIQAEPAKAGS